MRRIFVNNKLVDEATLEDLLSIAPNVGELREDMFTLIKLLLQDPLFDESAACGMAVGVIGYGPGRLEVRDVA